MLKIDHRMIAPGPERGMGLKWADIKVMCDSLTNEELDKVAILQDQNGHYCFLIYAGPMAQPLHIGTTESHSQLAPKGHPVLLVEEGVSLA